jgi:hypothetical protein
MPGVVVLDGHFSLLELKAIYTVAMDLWLKDLGEAELAKAQAERQS